MRFISRQRTMGNLSMSHKRHFDITEADKWRNKYRNPTHTVKDRGKCIYTLEPSIK